MSTRVHELAKELGLKSQDLIDRITKAGLDVKPSPLASLDPTMVDRIKELMRPDQSGTTAQASRTEAPAPQPVESPAIQPSAPPAPAQPKTPPPAPVAPVVERPSPAAEAPPSSSPAPAPTAVSSAPTSPASVVSPPAPAAPVSPAPAQAPPTSRPVASGSAAAGLARPPAGAPPTSPGSPPRTGGPLAGHGSRLGGSGPVQRPGTGPLSGHTGRDRPPGRPGPGAPAPGGPVRPGGPAPGYQGSNEPRQPQQPAAVSRENYISATGQRMGSQPMRQIPPVQQRRELPPGGEPPRRDGGYPQRPSRPLPSVASPTGGPPIQRPPGSLRPGPAPAEGKVTRPDMKFTPAQLLEMARSGQLGTVPPKLGPRPGGAPIVGRGAPGAPVAPRKPPLPGVGPGLAPPPPIDDEEGRGKAGPGGRLGGASDRAGRRAKRNERAKERSSISSPLPASALLEGDDDSRRSRGPKRFKGSRQHQQVARKSHAEIEPPISVRTLSEAIGVKANDLIRKLMNLGQLVTINAGLDDETAMMLAMEFGVELDVVHEKTAEDEMLDFFEDQEEVDASTLTPRAPVVTILGHVDHGKTSLLDRIRRSNVVQTESGGITQHIGAYQIDHNGNPITFVDTPGHEAFTAMRARGANVTDIVVLVVAADDGLMPQTVEAIAHAKAAEVPVVVALNKIDLPNVETTANINKIYGELSQQGLNPTEWGGDTEVIRTSATSGRGIDDLLTTLETLAELLELKSNPERPAIGTCLESSVSEGRGVVATVLVQEGTLKVGDVVACGDSYGRVRALFDDQGRSIQQAPPSMPVEISGLDQVPEAGERFAVLEDIGRAREVAETRRVRGRGASSLDRQALTLENLYSRMAEQKVKSLNLIIKADVQGSLEAIVKELEKLKNDEVPVRVLLKAVGGISESDIMLAEASDAIVVGFRVAPEDRATSLAEEKQIDVRRYDIIYQVTDEVKKAIEGLLVPETKEVILGAAVVRQVFKISKVGAVAGCYVTRGTVERTGKVRIFRDRVEIYKGSIEALKRFKDEVREVREGFECGIKIANYDDLKVDDIIECFRVDVIRRTL